MKIWIVLAVVLFASHAQAQEKADHIMRAGYVALGAVSLSDIETTRRGLELGLVEQNTLYKPFAGTTALIVNGAISTGLGFGTYALHKRGKKKEARIVIWTWTIVRAIVVAFNVWQIGRRK